MGRVNDWYVVSPEVASLVVLCWRFNLRSFYLSLNVDFLGITAQQAQLDLRLSRGSVHDFHRHILDLNSLCTVDRWISQLYFRNQVRQSKNHDPLPIYSLWD
jgi:hypothetical protein